MLGSHYVYHVYYGIYGHIVYMVLGVGSALGARAAPPPGACALLPVGMLRALRLLAAVTR